VALELQDLAVAVAQARLLADLMAVACVGGVHAVVLLVGPGSCAQL
jgi:hypothetical protein